MADIADQANEQAEYLLQVALSRRPVAARMSLKECEYCGDDIPEARRVAVQGCTTCVDCQEMKEQRRG